MSVKTALKRASKRIQLTPAEEAEARANRIVELRYEIDQKEAELAEITSELQTYVEQTGQSEFSRLIAIKRFGAARLVGNDLTPKEISYAEEQLMNELPDFVKRALDTSKMFNALKTNPQVANAIAAKGLNLEQKTSWTFRVKAG